MYNLWLFVCLEVSFAGKLAALENVHRRLGSVETTTSMVRDFASEFSTGIPQARNDVAWREQLIETTEDYETYVRQDSELPSDTLDSESSGGENSPLKRESLESAQSDSEAISSTLTEDDTTTVGSTASIETETNSMTLNSSDCDPCSEVTPTQSDSSTEFLINTDASEIVLASLSEVQTVPSPTDVNGLTSSEPSLAIQSTPDGQAILPTETLQGIGGTQVTENLDTTEGAAQWTSSISTQPEVEEATGNASSLSSVPSNEGAETSSEETLAPSIAPPTDSLGPLQSDATTENTNHSLQSADQTPTNEGSVDVGAEAASTVSRSVLDPPGVTESPSSTASEVESSAPEFSTSKTPDPTVVPTQAKFYPRKPKVPWNSKLFPGQRSPNVRIDRSRPCVTPSFGFGFGLAKDPLYFKRIFLQKTFNAITAPFAIKPFSFANFWPLKPLLAMRANIFSGPRRDSS